VVRYLKGTWDWELQLGGSRLPDLLGYSDSDYANNPGPQGRHSVGGYCLTLGSGMIFWSSKKQKTIATSTCAAEYIAVSEDASKLLCDNSAAVILSGNQVFHDCVKHLDI
jgi:hypothetical protein